MGLFRRIWPKHQLSDKVAFSFTHFGLVGIFLIELLIVLPRYYEVLSPTYCFHVLCALFLKIQVFSNMYMMLLGNTTIGRPGLMLPSVLRPGWYYCHICQLNAPPRSHHCPICEVCVVKRDHHCMFTGNCVGFFNHRYFVMMCLYLWIGCVYAFTFNMEYYGEILGEFEVYLLAKLFFPMLAWTLGFATGYQLFILIVCGVTCMAMFLFTCLLCFQIYFISRGQTQFECRKKVREYNNGFAENWLLVLGKSWHLTFLSAFFQSDLPGDGTSFIRSDIDMSPLSEDAKVL